MTIRPLLAVLPALLLGGCMDDLDSTAAAGSQDTTRAMMEDGEALAKANCASCHAIGRTGMSPNPKAPAFRLVLRRYNEDMLRTELADGMRVAHAPMPEFQFRPEAVDSLIVWLRSIQVQDKGQAIVEERCATCHATGRTDTSPYPGAQPFRNLGERWRRDQLREALVAGIIAEHDRAETRVPPMKLAPAEADAVLDYLDTVTTRPMMRPR
jgi:cytochrome c